MVLWVGAGLAGLIGLLTIDRLTADAPKALSAVTGTLIVIGLGLLAVARIKFEWAATQLDRAIQDGEVTADAPLPPELSAWPKGGEIAWLSGLVCVPVAALVWLAAVWDTVA
jgi:hypothetical protein